MDKFFTDLAAHTGADNVTVSVWPKHIEPVEVALWYCDEGEHYSAYGLTIDEAMRAAMAKRRASALSEHAQIGETQ